MILSASLLQLTQLFDIGFSFITADNTDRPNWRTNRKYRLTKGEFLKLYADALSLLGVSFGQKTRYVMLDIDIDSPYHPHRDPQAYIRLLFILERVGLVYPVQIRSSYSGGIHIYFFFPHAVKTFRIAALVRVTLINAGITIKNGQVEIFPNTKPYSEDKKKPTYYKAHRVPLQSHTGACLIDRWGDELLCAANLTQAGQLSLFLAEAERSAQSNDIEAIERKLDWAYNLFTDKISKYQYQAGNYSEIAQEWKENLELSFDIGWTDYHQTNELLPLFVCYGIVFEGLEDKQELFEWVHQKVTDTRGYSEYCRHQDKIAQRIWDWINSTIDNRYYITYCGFPPRCGITPHQLVARLHPHRSTVNLHNQTLVERTKQRLNDILAALEQLPIKIGDRIAAIQAKCHELFGQGISHNTLYKKEYKSIWASRELVASGGEISKNPTPLSIVPEPTTKAESDQISSETNISIEIDQTQTEAEFSHTTPIYEALIADSSSPPDLVLDPSSSLSTLTDLQVRSNCDLDLLTHSPQESEQILLNTDFVRSHTTEIIQQLSPERITCSKQVRSVVEVARAVRANIAAIDDELLLEFLHHPQHLEIELAIELAERLVAARTEDLVRAVVADLSPCQKVELWDVLAVEERAAVTAVMDRTDPTSAFPVLSIGVGTKLRRNACRVGSKEYPVVVDCEVIARNGMDWVVRSGCGSSFNVSNYAIDSGWWEIDVPESAENLPDAATIGLAVGATVSTLTGLVGVLKHVFKSVTKPFLVYHESIGRTILYRGEDLRLSS